MADVGRDQARDDAWTAAAQPRCHREILPAIHPERNREALYGGSETRLPRQLAGLDVDRLELAVEIADERDTAGGREDPGQKRGALLERRSAAVPPPPATNSMIRPRISMQLWLSGMIRRSVGAW